MRRIVEWCRVAWSEGQPISEWARVCGLIGGMPLLAAGLLLALLVSLYMIFLFPLFFLVYAGPPALLVYGALRAPAAPLSAGCLMLGLALIGGWLCWGLAWPTDVAAVFHPTHVFTEYLDLHLPLLASVFGGAGGLSALAAAGYRRASQEPRLGLLTGLPVVLVLGAFCLFAQPSPPFLEAIQAQGWVRSTVIGPGGFGKTVAGAVVVFHREPHRKVGADVPASFEATTDAKGWFKVGVAPGYYRVEVRHPDFEPQSRNVGFTIVNERRESTHDFSLKPKTPG